ncbi:hypothetical protein HYS47_00715 [Candidatus Woesearchaeota archaeon]|nr:hypothetical protein [Candidatus Woesearchaeota archaeon]
MTTKKHQGQITAFIVVGILILVLTGILVGLYVSNEQPLKGKETISTLSFDSAAIENALNACLQKASGEAIALLSKQGGYIYTFPHLTFYDGWQVAYHYDNGRDISPTKQFMEGEMSRYAAEALLACASNSFLPLYEGATIKKPMVITAIEDGLVVFEVEFPITIQKDRSTITISKLYHNIPVRLQHVLDVKQQILNSIRNNNDNTLRLDELSSYDVDITLLQTDGKTRIYSIKDQSSALSENSVLLFNFAVRQPTTAPPQLQFIPDVIIDAGQEYNLVAKADDPDSSSIQFSIKNGPGMIEPDTGRYFFTPTSPGIQTATICASDGSLEDCETFMITVKEQIIT